MKTSTKSGEIYSSKWIGQKFKEHYQDLVYYASKPGIATKVFFTDMSNSVWSDAWYIGRRYKIQEENYGVISAAARLLLRWRSSETELYSTSKGILLGNDFLPLMSKYFMILLVGPEIKQAAIGHSWWEEWSQKVLFHRCHFLLVLKWTIL